jgi:mono/diheme cytochrome c family protein
MGYRKTNRGTSHLRHDWAPVIPMAVLTALVAAQSVLAASDERPASHAASQDFFRSEVAPFLGRYCTQCHGGIKPKGGLALDLYRDETSLQPNNVKAWRKVVSNVRSHEMPPARRRQPTSAEIAPITSWLSERLSHLETTAKPERISLRRLNRAEYNNTIRDLLGVDFHPADDFPGDEVGYGFDNIGDLLSMAPILMEKYLSAADKVVTAVFRDPKARERLLTCPPGKQETAERARQILGAVASRAYRRPATSVEIDRLVYLFDVAQSNGDTFEAGIRLALKAVLVSPHFLFRVELDSRGKDIDAVHSINDYELASRLSYFLWSSMPDEKLFEHARHKTLRTPGILESEVQRMLRDPKAQALVENFAGQWLQTRNLKAAAPDPGRFPDFDDGLRTAMVRETELFFQSIIREDRSILDFVDANYTFMNERLARHYGIKGIKGATFQRVTLPPERGGVLTQSSVLTVTSNPTRTSPVKRGKWILENLLGAPPPPPPPGAGDLNESKEVANSESLRKRMEQHRANPSCASCHERMDPLGFGLENFDATGAWRERDGKFAIDASGTLPGGQSFNGPRELRAILKSRSDAFCRCLTEKMFTYALGRGVEPFDQPAVERICQAMAADNYRFSRLVIEIVKSDPFQNTRGR